MDMYEAIIREIRFAGEQYRPLAQIRVSADAIEGTVSAVPMTPERARNLGELLTTPSPPHGFGGIRGLGGFGGSADEVVAFGDPQNERLLEVLIHPEDWRQLLVEMPPLALATSGSVTRLAGIPVAQT